MKTETIRARVEPAVKYQAEAIFTVNASTFVKFLAMMDQPLPPTDKLRRLLKTKAPWDDSLDLSRRS